MAVELNWRFDRVELCIMVVRMVHVGLVNCSERSKVAEFGSILPEVGIIEAWASRAHSARGIVKCAINDGDENVMITWTCWRHTVPQQQRCCAGRVSGYSPRICAHGVIVSYTGGG